MESEASHFCRFAKSRPFLISRTMCLLLVAMEVSVDHIASLLLWPIMPRGVSKRGELRRLAASHEGDWTHCATGDGPRSSRRARGGGENDIILVPEAVNNATMGSEVAITSSSSGEESTDDDTAVAPANPKKKPTHSRVMVEVSQLEQAFANYQCPKCDQKLELKIKTLCIASSLELICNNQDCSYICGFDRPSPTTIHDEDDYSSYERMTNYAVNVLFVLGFVSVGDGSTEAGRLLGLLGLPNDTTMMNRSFGIIEERLGPFIRELCGEIIKENIDTEAKASMNEFDYNVWKVWTDGDTILCPLPVERMPQLEASYDMAWQQKGSGHQYNSTSGHGTLFGRYSRKVIGLVIKSKRCCFCNTFLKSNPGQTAMIPWHHCWKNHEGSSGSMEASGAVEVLVEAFEKHKVVIKRLCCDDDSSIRADCQWSNANYLKNNNTTELPMVPKTLGKNKGKLQPRPDKGKLPGHVPEPLFVADPNHRRKLLSGDLIKLDSSKVDMKFTMTRMDTTRLAKNFGYMARTLRDRPETEYVEAASACLEHHFDNHEYCGSWCKRKLESDEMKQSKVKYYRCKEKDAKLYSLLTEKMARFVTQERLNEMAHTLDTNMNEAFNNICTWFAPKNKVFSGTGSLHNRIGFAVCINSIGIELFFKRLFKKLGLPLTANVAYYLDQKEKSRVKRLAKVKTKEAKILKNKKKNNKMVELTNIAKKERHRRDGTYRTGMNLDDPGADDVEPPAPKKGKINAAKYCEYCRGSNHLTRKSMKCTAQDSVVKKYNKFDGSLLSANEVPQPPGRATTGPPVLTGEALLAQQDCDAMDSMPFDAEYESDEDGNLATFLMDWGDSDDDDDSHHHYVGAL
jgi:hypothetical protein